MSCGLRIVAMAVCLGVSPLLWGQAGPEAADLSVLRSASVDSNGTALVKFFKKRTVAEGTRAKVLTLIGQLGSDDFDTRVKSEKALVEMGAVARAQLTQALRSTDVEVRRRARWALEKIGTAASEAHLLPAAARVLAARKADGACEALLDYLPSVEEPDVAEQVARAMAPLAVDKDGKPLKAVLDALGDRYAIKRYAAAHALIKAGGKEHRPAVLKVLNDADAGVRRRVAVALLEARDKAALPALLKLLESANADDAAAAEDALCQVAGDKAPEPPEGDTVAARAKYRKAWEAWYRDTGSKLDLAKVDFSDIGRNFTLLAMLDRTGVTGKVQEWDSTGRVRWSIDGLKYPIHVTKTRRDRVLICEYQGNQVTERDTKGNVVWSIKTPMYQVLSAQRLKNGHTFVATRNTLMTYDRVGREVRRLQRTDYLLAAHAHQDGSISLLNNQGQWQKLDKNGRTVRTLNIGAISSSVGMRVHFLPTGGLVVPDYSRSTVREYDADGKLVVQFSSTRPNAVVKLADGKYLVGARMQFEIRTVDRTGRLISTQTTAGRPMYLDRR